MCCDTNLDTNRKKLSAALLGDPGTRQIAFVAGSNKIGRK